MDFYSPLSRFWELLAGGALAWFAHNGALRIPSRLTATMLSVAGLGLIALADFGLDKDLSFPGWRALLPVCGAWMTIAAGETAWLNRRLLANPVMIGIGLISYPLYLWHWPLLSYAQILSGESPERSVRIGMVVLAFALAALTYKFVEQPIRKKSSSPRSIGLLVAAMIVVGGSGGVIALTDGLPQRFLSGPVSAQALDGERLQLTWQRNVRLNQCHLQDTKDDRQSPECVETTRPSLMLWGDSHAASLYPGLKHLQEQQGFGIIQLTQSGCPPILDVPRLIFRPNCDAINRRILAQITDLKPDAILLAAAWQHHDYPMENPEIVKRLLTTIARIQQASPQSRVVVFGPEPRWLSPLPAIYRRALTLEGHAPPQRLPEHIDPAEIELDGLMKTRLAGAGVAYLSPQSLLCDANGCLTRLGDGLDSLTFIDEEHVTAVTSIFLMHQFAPALLAGQ
jgi:hypothetical protein